MKAGQSGSIQSRCQGECRMSRVDKNGLAIETVLHDFLVDEVLPGLAVDADRFFADFSAVVHDLAPKNRALLAKRDELQVKIDDWYRRHGAPVDMDDYQSFLREIGYLLPEGSDFQVSTDNV